MENKEYKVGYGKPPKEYQFKKGVSGNKAGRKKKPVPNSLYEAFLIEANAMTEIKNRNGKIETVKNAEIIMKATFRDAFAKDGPSRKFILEQFLKTDIVSGYNAILDRQSGLLQDELDSEIKKQLLNTLAEMIAKKDFSETE